METEIKESLIRLMQGIKSGDGHVVATETAHLDDVASRFKLSLNPLLVHFLEGRSYAKALNFLRGDAVP